MQISKNGMVSFGKDDNNTNSQPFIAAYWANISTVDIYHTEITYDELNVYKQQRFKESKRKIMDLLNLGFGCSLKGFNLTHILLITWSSAFKIEMGVSYF